MALSRLGNRNRPGDFTWPGFVDALASLLMVFVFVLMVFVLIQANLAYRLSGKDARLIEIRNELAMLGELLSLEREAGAVLSADLARTRSQLEVAELRNNNLLDDLARLGLQLNAEQDKNSQLATELTAEEARYEHLLAELAAQQTRFSQEIADANARIASQSEVLAGLEGALSGAQTALAQRANELASQQALTDEAGLEIERLTIAIRSLQSELGRLRTLLADKNEQSKKDKIAIANLGRELNNALANKVQELHRFRSEFFGRLRAILEGRNDVIIVGDRFVFQSEVLFAPGRASIGADGKAQLAIIAGALIEIISEIPSDIPWILQVDGHTDDIPVADVYADNWDLSTERALSVVRFMNQKGVPSNRLAATGYGEFQPISTENTDAARQKNRRIELKLTQRVRAE